MSAKRKIVVAGSWLQFREWCREQSIDPKTVTFIGGLGQMFRTYGVRDFEIVRIGTWQDLDPDLLKRISDIEQREGLRGVP